MKTVIAGLEEGLNAIADALEGGGGEGAVVPVPTLDDDGKVLRVVSQSQDKVAPEWSEIREVSRGGRNGQVLTKNGDDYGWENPSGGLPPLYSEEDKDKALIAHYDSDTEAIYPEWSMINQVPSGGIKGQVLTKTSGRGYEWANASGGGGSSSIKHIYQAFRGNTIFDDNNGNATITINNVPSGINEDSFCPLGIVVRYYSSGGSYPKYCNVIPVKGMNVGNLLGTGMMITVIVDSANVTEHLTSSDYYDIGIVYYEKESM